jgi:D-inositol-3-phosphate glycosyltransferase
VTIGSGVAKWRPPQSSGKSEIVRAALSTVALYTAIAWCYVAVVAVLRPSFLSESVTHWLPVRRDTFGTVCFAVSAVTSTALGVLRVRNQERPHPGGKDVDGLGMLTNILLVSHYFPPHIGGIENVVGAEAAGLAEMGHNVTIVTTGVRADRRATKDGQLNVRYLRACHFLDTYLGVPFPITSPWSLVTLVRLARRADVIHTHDAHYMTAWLAALASRLTRTPLVVTQHVAMIEHPSGVVMAAQSLIHHTMGRLVLRTARRIVCLNSRVASFVVERGAARPTLEFLPNGIDTDSFRPVADSITKHRLRQELGLPRDAVLALFVGRFVPKKGYSKLIEVGGGDSYKVVFVGGDAPAGTQGRTDLIFMGTCTPDQMAEIYRAVDIFILPSVSEGFPLSAQEAMASGLPIVLGDDPGYGIYEFDATRIMLIDPTLREIEAALEKLAADADLRRDMSLYSSTFAATRFSRHGHMSGLITVYKNALGHHGRRTAWADRRRGPTWRGIIAVLAPTAAIYGLLIWGYIAANSIAHPETLALPLTHFMTWPAEGDTGAALFAVSTFAHFLYRAVGSSDQTQAARRTLAPIPNPRANRHRTGAEHSGGDRVATVSETIGATAIRSGCL